MNLTKQLREYAANNGYSHGDYADTMRQAADRIVKLEAHVGVLQGVVNAFDRPAAPVVAEGLTNQEIRKIMHNYSRMHQPGHYSDTEFNSLQDVIGFVRAILSIYPVAPADSSMWVLLHNGKSVQGKTMMEALRLGKSLRTEAEQVAAADNLLAALEQERLEEMIARRDREHPEIAEAAYKLAGLAAHPVAGSHAEALSLADDGEFEDRLDEYFKARNASYEFDKDGSAARAADKAKANLIAYIENRRAAEPMPASEAQAELGRMRQAFHINMLRAFPEKSHAEISAEIDKACGAAPVPASEAASESGLLMANRALAEENRQLMAKANEWRDKFSESEESRHELLRLLNEETGGKTFMGEPAVQQRPDVSEMVNRFLGWRLPDTFAPDCGISFDGRKDDEWNKNKSWPIGTNLLNADQARAMFEYVLASRFRAEGGITNDSTTNLAAPAAPTDAKPDGGQQ